MAFGNTLTPLALCRGVAAFVPAGVAPPSAGLRPAVVAPLGAPRVAKLAAAEPETPWSTCVLAGLGLGYAAAAAGAYGKRGAFVARRAERKEDVQGRGELPPRGIVQTKLGGVHYVTSGSFDSTLTPILAFHMSPRSVDEFKEVMPLLSASERLVVAIDELGYGSSDNPISSCTLDQIADGALLIADQLRLKNFIVCGSLMGNFFSLSLASRYPDRVKACVLTNCYHYPEAKVNEAKEKHANPDKDEVNDDFAIKEDGSHFLDIFNARKPWLRSDMNTRATLDDLVYKMKRRERYAAGVSIQDGPLFAFEQAARGTKCPVLCVQGTGATAFFDMIGFEMTSQLEKAIGHLPNATATTVDGHINLLNTHAKEWHDAVSPFLGRVSL